MRELTNAELAWVAGAGDSCGGEGQSGTGGNEGNGEVNDLGGVRNPEGIGDDLVNIYEGLVQLTSHVIERVATSL